MNEYENGSVLGRLRILESARGLAHSRTLRARQAAPDFRQVLDCGGPPPLFRNHSWRAYSDDVAPSTFAFNYGATGMERRVF
jgi:hypothetical protein